MIRSPIRARRRARTALVALAAIVFAASIAAGQSSTPAFDSSRAFEHVRQLVAIGPRPPGSPGSQQARHYIKALLQGDPQAREVIVASFREALDALTKGRT